MFKKCLFLSAFLILALPLAAGQYDQGCFSIVAGKAATVDGSVLVGHNEDNQIDNIAAMRKIPRKEHSKGEWVELSNGGRLAQVEITFAHWWLQMPEQNFSDAHLNENGVAILSDSCPSREDRTDFTDGGICDPLLRRLVAERARTARDGVKIVGSLVEKFGYTATGRTFVIADTEEGWLVAVAKGRHWVAARVPDDKVALIANTYTIAEVDLADEKNFLACHDLIDYAVERGWYDPADGAFSFEKAYAAPGSRRHRSNIHRQWSGLLRLSADPIPVPAPAEGPLAFCVTPKDPLGPEHLAAVLRDHYETAPVRVKKGRGKDTPHNAHASTVCSPRTNSSSILQLRPGMPVEIGALWWYALWQPCSTPYMPLYLGTADVPELLRFPGPEQTDAAPAYQTFSDLARWVDDGYDARIGPVREAWRVLEQANYGFQQTSEKHLLELWDKSPLQARALMTSHCGGTLAGAVERARTFLRED